MSTIASRPNRWYAPTLLYLTFFCIMSPACVDLSRPSGLDEIPPSPKEEDDLSEAGVPSSQLPRDTAAVANSAMDAGFKVDLPSRPEPDAGMAVIADLRPAFDTVVVVDQAPTPDRADPRDLLVVGPVDAPGLDAPADLAADLAADLNPLFPPDMGPLTPLTQGTACSTGSQCSSGFCTDGVCCERACNGSCELCSAGLGQCVAVPAGTDPANECLDTVPATCGTTGQCNGSRACAFHPAGTSCGAAALCTNGQSTAATTCNGTGQCLPAVTGPCGAYDCAATACRTSCLTATDCALGNACAKNVSQCQPLSGLALWWKFDETTGTTASDSSGSGNAGAWVNGPTPSTDVPVALSRSSQRSLTFSLGGVHSVERPLNGSLKPATITISAWFKTTSTAPQGEIISAGDSYMLRVRSDSLELIKRVPTMWRTARFNGTDHLNNTWHHFAGVISATSMRLYYDGILRAETPDTDQLTYDLGTKFVIGRHGNNSPDFDFIGQIDDPRIYDRPLSDDEISALFLGR